MKPMMLIQVPANYTVRPPLCIGALQEGLAGRVLGLAWWLAWCFWLVGCCGTLGLCGETRKLTNNQLTKSETPKNIGKKITIYKDTWTGSVIKNVRVQGTTW